MEGGGADDKENAEARQQLLERLLSSGMLNSVKVGAKLLSCKCSSLCRGTVLPDARDQWPLPAPAAKQARLRAQLFAQLKGGSLANALAPAPSPTLQQHVLNCLVGGGRLAADCC